MEISPNSLIFSIIVTIYLTLLFGNGVDVANARAYFVFGDSLVDNGNNNFLATTARADGPPYGIDSPSHQPSGRFSNGLNIVDLIGEYFGFQPNHPYLDPNFNGEQLLAGANFASAGVGILNDTGFQFLNIVGINQQLEYFKEYQGKVTKLIGPENTTKLVNKSLTLISLGGNDFVNNYYLFPFTLRSFQFSLSNYCSLLISEYQKILEKLYQLGPGKVIVTGTGPLGCAPGEKAQRSQNGECAAELQTATDTFAPLLTNMVLGLNKKIGKDIFVVTNTNDFSLQIVTNPQAYGFENSNDACCGQGPHNGIGLCTVISNLCQNREKYVYWDPFHPTERGNRLMLEQMIKGTTKYMNPMNLSTIKAMFSNDPLLF